MRNPAGMWPQLWALVSALLGVFGVSFTPTPVVKAACALGAGLVLAVWQWQHHATVRHADALAARLHAQKAAAAPPERAVVPRIDVDAALVPHDLSAESGLGSAP